MTVEFRYNESAKGNAFLVNFTNGKLNMENPGIRLPKFTLFEPERPSSSSKRKKVLLAETDSMTYVGRNFGPDRPPEGMCKYLFGILDRKSSIMTLHEAESFLLHPKPQMAEGSQTEEEKEEAESYKEQRIRLIESFGSRKQKKVVKQREGGLVKGDSLKTVLAETRQHEEIRDDDDDEARLLESQAQFIPPFNSSAEKPEDVFPVDGVVSSACMAALKEPAKAFRTASLQNIHEWKTSKKYCEFVLASVEILQTIGSGSVKREKSKLIRYIAYLLALHRRGDKRRVELSTQSLEKMDIPPVVGDYIREKFGERVENVGKEPKTVITKSMRNKLTLYILVLALLIRGFSYDCTLLAKDLQMKPPEMAQHLKAIGCTMTVTDTDSKSSKSKARKSGRAFDDVSLNAELKVPFEIQERSRKNKKSRKVAF